MVVFSILFGFLAIAIILLIGSIAVALLPILISLAIGGDVSARKSSRADVYESQFGSIVHLAESGHDELLCDIGYDISGRRRDGLMPQYLLETGYWGIDDDAPRICEKCHRNLNK